MREKQVNIYRDFTVIIINNPKQNAVTKKMNALNVAFRWIFAKAYLFGFRADPLNQEMIAYARKEESFQGLE